MTADHNLTELKKIEKKLDRVITLLGLIVNNTPSLSDVDIRANEPPPADAADALIQFKNGSFIKFEGGRMPGVIKTYGVSQNGETTDGT